MNLGQLRISSTKLICLKVRTSALALTISDLQLQFLIEIHNRQAYSIFWCFGSATETDLPAASTHISATEGDPPPDRSSHHLPISLLDAACLSVQ